MATKKINNILEKFPFGDYLLQREDLKFELGEHFKIDKLSISVIYREDKGQYGWYWRGGRGEDVLVKIAQFLIDNNPDPQYYMFEKNATFYINYKFLDYGIRRKFKTITRVFNNRAYYPDDEDLLLYTAWFEEYINFLGWAAQNGFTVAKLPLRRIYECVGGRDYADALARDVVKFPTMEGWRNHIEELTRYKVVRPMGKIEKNGTGLF